MRRLSFARGSAYLLGVAALFITTPALSAKAVHHKPKAAVVKADAPAAKADDEPAPKPSDELPPAPETKAPAEPDASPVPAAPVEPEHQPAPKRDAKPALEPDQALSGNDDEALGRRERLRLAGGHSE